MRKIRDAAGVEWTVYEVNPALGEWRSMGALPESHRNGWLCFECETEKRRLLPLPEGWQQMPMEQLAVLLMHAAQVRRVAQYGQ